MRLLAVGSVLLFACLFDVRAQEVTKPTCACGDGKNEEGMLTCMHDHLKQKMEKKAEFLKSPPDCDNPKNERDEFICSRCLTEYSNAKDELSKLREDMNSCVDTDRRHEIRNKIEDCGKVAMIEGCNNPRDVPPFLEFIAKRMKQRCELDDEEPQEVKETGAMALIRNQIRKKLGLSEDCDLKQKAKELKDALIGQYKTTKPFFECIRDNKEEICDQIKTRRTEVRQKCLTNYQCNERNIFGAIKGMYDKCKGEFDIEVMKEQMMRRCICIAGKAKIEDPASFCQC